MFSKMDAISSSPLHNREVNEPVKYVHKINLWFINVKNELRKICGPHVGEELPRNRGRVSQFRRIPRELIIQTNNGIPMSGGLSMIRLANKNDGVYFKFNHSKNYQIAHLSFLLVSDHRFTNPQFSPHDNTYKHMEAMLEIADSLFFKNECLIASNIIESIIYQMQSAVHPHFRISDTMCRLEYRYIENRAFHIALLKYAYIVSNRACHRTALEICKVLMNLDQSDPLAVAFVIDTFAIRAREYEWLVNAIEYLNKEKSASSMFNMAYSHALAKYHLAIRDNNERDKCAATELLRNAIYGFPVIAMFYLQLASCREAVNFPTDPFFYLHSHCEIRDVTKAMEQIYFLYAKLTFSRWCEPGVFGWLKNTVLFCVQRYHMDTFLQRDIYFIRRHVDLVYHEVPIQLLRHLCVIKSMSGFVADGAVPYLSLTRLSDPLPDAKTLDCPGYSNFSSNYSPSLRQVIASNTPAIYVPPPNMESAPRSTESNATTSQFGVFVNILINTLQLKNILLTGRGNSAQFSDEAYFDSD